MKEKIRVLLVDDHSLLRQTLVNALQKEEDVEVIGDLASAEELWQYLNDPLMARPHVLVLDLNLQDSSGLEILKDLTQRFPNIHVLVLSMYSERIYGERVLQAGGRGYVMKEASFDEFLQAIRQVAHGEFYLSPSMMRQMVGRLARQRGKVESIGEKLTDRELEVFRLIGQGCTTKEIADKLAISPKTVDTYRERIKRKLNLKNASELVQQAVLWFEKGG